jgi:hypothetical protein
MMWGGAVGVLAVVGVTLGLSSIDPADGSSDFGVDYGSCWYSAEKRKLTARILDEEGTVGRRGGRIVMLSPKTHGGLEALRCRGGKATIRKVDRINLQIRAEGATTGTVSLAGGPLAPGHAPEPDSPEIELTVTIADSFADPAFAGCPGDDHFRGGTLGAVEGLNLNAASEPVAPDVDVRLRKAARASVEFHMGAGNDTLDLGGGPEFLGAYRTGYNLVTLGPGADRLIGTSATDYVLASPGADAYSTSAGDDAIHSQDGLIETVDCGPGTDLVQPDASDVLIDCEEIGGVGLAD